MLGADLREPPGACRLRIGHSGRSVMLGKRPGSGVFWDILDRARRHERVVATLGVGMLAPPTWGARFVVASYVRTPQIGAGATALRLNVP